MAAKLLKKRFNIQNVNDWLKENDENMDGKLKIFFIFLLTNVKTCFYIHSMASQQN